MSYHEHKCPSCGEPFSLFASASLPEETSLTLSLKVTPGQMMRLDTVAGVLSSWRDLQIAVGKEMGAATDVFLADVSMKDNEFHFTTAITNVRARAAQEQQP